MAAVQRGRETLVPRGGTVLRSGDSLVLGAGSYREDGRIELQEITLQPQNPWVGSSIRDLDISRQTLIVMVRRRGQTLIPNGGLVLLDLGLGGSTTVGVEICPYIRINLQLSISDNFSYKCFQYLGIQSQTRHKIHSKPQLNIPQPVLS